MLLEASKGTIWYKTCWTFVFGLRLIADLTLLRTHASFGYNLKQVEAGVGVNGDSGDCKVLAFGNKKRQLLGFNFLQNSFLSGFYSLLFLLQQYAGFKYLIS